MHKHLEISSPTSCFNKAKDDERLFILPARDPAAPVAIRAWIAERLRLGMNKEGDIQLHGAAQCAGLMELERPQTEPLLKFSIFSKTQNLLAVREAHWEAFVSFLRAVKRTPCSLESCSGKTCLHKNTDLWSPGDFKSIIKLSAGAPLALNPPFTMLALFFLVFDVDAAPEAEIVTMRDALSPYQHLIHATHGDQQDRRSLRVILPLRYPLDPLHGEKYWLVAKNLFHIPADLACRDIFRKYYTPSRPCDADYFFVSQAGTFLDVTLLDNLTGALDSSKLSPIGEGRGDS